MIPSVNDVIDPKTEGRQHGNSRFALQLHKQSGKDGVMTENPSSDTFA